MKPFIHPTSVIYPNVIFGANIYVGAFCVIGGPAEHRDFWDDDSKGMVVIGDNVRISNHVTVDSGTEEITFIGDRCVLLAHSHVGHDARLENDVTISCGAKIGGHVRIGKHSNVGLNAVIHQHQVVPDGCMIGMGAVVTSKLIMEPFNIYAGNPAKIIGANSRLISKLNQINF